MSEDNPMNPTTPPPHQVAREAAEAIKEVANDVLRRHADADPGNQSVLIGDAILPDLTALILSAAAKMVQQSGAVAAFESLLESGHETCDFAARCGLGDEETTKGARGALKLLRSISEGEGV